MIGIRFTKYIENLAGNTPFDKLLKLFLELLTITSGDAFEALNWLSEIDKKYKLTDDSYGVGDFIEDLKKKDYLKEDENQNVFVITSKTEQSIRRQSLEEIFGKLKKSKRGGIGVALVALILFALLGGSKEEIIQVQTEKAEKRDITQKVSTTGKIEPEFKVVITPEVTGEIVALPVKEGDKVKKGDLLIKINAKQYLADRESAEATLLSSKSGLAMRKAELDRIALDYERVKGLHNKGLASDSEIETAKSNFESIKASYDGAKANVLSTEASLKRVVDSIFS